MSLILAFDLKCIVALVVKNPPAKKKKKRTHLLMQVDVKDPSSIPECGRSLGEGNGNPLEYSCLEKLMDREAWQAAVHKVAESDTTEAT